VLGIQEFGILVLILSLFNLVTDLSDMGLSSAIVRFGAETIERGDLSRFQKVVSTVFRLKLILGVIVIGLAALFLNPIVSYVFHHVDERIAFYFLFSLCGAAINIVAGTFPPIFQAFKDFRKMSLVGLSRPMAKVLCILLCLVIVPRWSVALGVGVEIISLLMFLGVSYQFSPVKRFSLRVHDKDITKQVMTFNKWISLHQVVTLLGGRVDVFFVGGLSDANALGLYGAATKIAGLVSMVSLAYFGVLLPEFSSSPSYETIRGKRRVSLMVVGLIATGIGVLALVAGPLITIVFGEVFSGAIPLLQIMCIGLLFTVLSYPFSASLFALDTPIVFPVASALSLTAFIAGNIMFIPRMGVTGAAVAFAASGCVTFIVSILFFLFKGRKGTAPGIPE
jgi:O-antigen/teichoic acid export membrane protein